MFRRRAFTLVELLVVIAVLSVISLLLISYTGDIDNVSVDGATWKIQSDIRHAQQLAGATGVPHGVQFVMSGNYTVYTGNVSTPILDPLDRKPMVEDVSQFGRVHLGNSFTVEFDSMGRPTIGGGGNVEVVADSGASRRIYIIANTGAVIVDVLGYGSSCSCRVCE